MAVGVLQEFEATVEQYDQVNEKVNPGGNPPDGLILHCGGEIGGGKMRVFDIWETADAFEKFAEERLGPAIGEVMGADAAPPTVREVNELHDVIQP